MTLPAPNVEVLGVYCDRVFRFKRVPVRGTTPPSFVWQKLVNRGWYTSDPPERWAPMPEWVEIGEVPK
jgi:hypothetical protein